MNRFRVTIILLFGGFMQIDLTDKPRPLDEKWLFLVLYYLTLEIQ